MIFKLGDTVTYLSQSLGSTYQRKGKIVKVLKPEETLNKAELKKLGNTSKLTVFRYYPVNGDHNLGQNKRTHESYIVLEENGFLYHPVVTKLSIVNG